MSMNKIYLRSFITAVIIFSLVLLFTPLNHANASNANEVTAHTVRDSDDIITGIMDEFSKSMIIVDGIRHSLCKNVMAFNLANKLIKLNDIEAAVEVKLFRNINCVRKITVLNFAN